MQYLSKNENIKIIEFETILPIWKNKLWPDRISKIEETSAMKYLGGIDIDNMENKAIFLSYQIDDVVVGVNSCHCCADNSFRSRGLYVSNEYRKRGIGKALLTETIEIANINNALFIWSYPKKSSWNVYSNSGFILTSEWHQSELDINAYCQSFFTPNMA